MSASVQVLMPNAPRPSRAQAASIALGCDELTRARVRAAGAGDLGAQRWLAEAVLSDVRKVARSLTQRTADADDAAQFAILEVLRAAADFRGDASVRHWARRVATWAVLKHRRTLITRRARERDVDACAGLDGFASASAPEPVDECLPRSLREYLGELPEEQREAVVLRHALGYSLAEIATFMGVSLNTVKSRLRLGLKQLRRRIRQDMFVGDAARGRERDHG